jgi:cystathionine beta-lyase/cystathionine gamma-synthase
MKPHPNTLLAVPAQVRRAQLPVTPEIVQTTTFHMDAELDAAMAGGDYRSQFLYTRMGNPTVEALQRQLASLHGAESCVCTASGMGAISAALFGLMRPGGIVIADTQLYGVTQSFLRNYLEPAGRHVWFANLADPSERARIATLHPGSDDNTDTWVLVETLSNPLIQPADLPAMVEFASAIGAGLMVDNTFAGPTVCRPLELGADVVIESLSKIIAGHSDVHGGAVLGYDTLVEKAWSAMLHLGTCLDPHAAWLVMRGLRTLHLRAPAAAANAVAVADWLRAHPEVEEVYFPSVPPGWLSSPGQMLSFVVVGGDVRAERLLEHLQLIARATSLGGTESLASLPFNTSHRTPQAREAVGLKAGTVRLSVGIEHIGDLIADLDQALEASAAP